MSCGKGHKCGSDLVLLWLWHRPAAVAPIQSLARELPYVERSPKKKKKKKKKRYWENLLGGLRFLKKEHLGQKAVKD